MQIYIPVSVAIKGCNMIVVNYHSKKAFVTEGGAKICSQKPKRSEPKILSLQLSELAKVATENGTCLPVGEIHLPKVVVFYKMSAAELYCILSNVHVYILVRRIIKRVV